MSSYRTALGEVFKFSTFRAPNNHHFETPFLINSVVRQRVSTPSYPIAVTNKSHGSTEEQRKWQAHFMLLRFNLHYRYSSREVWISFAIKEGCFEQQVTNFLLLRNSKFHHRQHKISFFEYILSYSILLCLTIISLRYTSIEYNNLSAVQINSSTKISKQNYVGIFCCWMYCT